MTQHTTQQCGRAKLLWVLILTLMVFILQLADVIQLENADTLIFMELMQQKINTETLTRFATNRVFSFLLRNHFLFSRRKHQRFHFSNRTLHADK